MLPDGQKEEMEQDLIDLEEILENTPTKETDTIRELCKKKEYILKRLGRRVPFSF